MVSELFSKRNAHYVEIERLEVSVFQMLYLKLSKMKSETFVDRSLHQRHSHVIDHTVVKYNIYGNKAIILIHALSQNQLIVGLIHVFLVLLRLMGEKLTLTSI